MTQGDLLWPAAPGALVRPAGGREARRGLDDGNPRGAAWPGAAAPPARAAPGEFQLLGKYWTQNYFHVGGPHCGRFCLSRWPPDSGGRQGTLRLPPCPPRRTHSVTLETLRARPSPTGHAVDGRVSTGRGLLCEGPRELEATGRAEGRCPGPGARPLPLYPPIT